MTNFYVIETQYVGPNQDEAQYVDADRIEICTAPATGNMSRKECTDGWCGTSNGWAVYAHGVYDSIESARGVIADKFGEVRETDPHLERFCNPYDANVIEVYKPGRYTPMGRDETAEWLQSGVEDDIDAATTDARIIELAADYERVANTEGFTLWDAEGVLLDMRQDMIDAGSYD